MTVITVIGRLSFVKQVCFIYFQLRNEKTSLLQIIIIMIIKGNYRYFTITFNSWQLNITNYNTVKALS